MKSYVKLFEQFLSENSYSCPYPMQIIMRGFNGLTGKDEDFTIKAMDVLYEKYIRLILVKGYDEYERNSEIPKNRRLNVDFNYPIINQTSTLHAFLKDPRAKVFQNLEDFLISSKDMFHHAFKDVDFVPKTVFSIEDIKSLQLPIIAKPADGFSAQGIEIFETYEKAKNSKLKFDIWSEAKDIKREFRAFIFGNKIIHITERIHNKDNPSKVGKKKPHEKINLVYIDQNLESFPYLQEIQRITNEICKKVNLVFFCIDLMVDSNQKMWVPEINGAPGIGPSIFYSVYKEWVPFAYSGLNISPEDHAILSKIALDHRKNMANEYPEEYKNSLCPLI